MTQILLLRVQSFPLNSCDTGIEQGIRNQVCLEWDPAFWSASLVYIEKNLSINKLLLKHQCTSSPIRSSALSKQDYFHLFSISQHIPGFVTLKTKSTCPKGPVLFSECV